MNVLRVVALRSKSGAYGGPSDTALGQSRMIADRGANVRLLSGVLAGDEPAKDRTLEKLAIIAVRVRQLSSRLGMATLCSFAMLRTINREVRASDVVHISFAREFIPIAVCISAFLSRTPYIVQPHGMLTARSSRLHRVLDLVVKPLFRRSSVVIALTQVESKELSNWCAQGTPAIVSVGNPLLLSDPPTTGVKGNREALFVARLEPRKRVSDFADAARISSEAGHDIRFVIVGPDQGDLQSVKRSLSVARNLVYEGSLPSNQVSNRLASTGVFVLPSLNEPWGNVLVQALSLGVPVVVTRSAALSSAIEEFGAGIVVDDESPAQIAKAVAYLLRSDESRLRASTAAEQLAAAMFSQEVLSNALWRAYLMATEP